jgi:hypothetical protein
MARLLIVAKPEEAAAAPLSHLGLRLPICSKTKKRTWSYGQSYLD